jgi:hypothetical protein
MGSQFVEKHKRKSVLAALLLIFQGRVKYVAILLIVTVLSVPFVMSGETLGRIIELRPVAAFLRSVGMGSVVSAVNPRYSNDMLRAALDKASADSEQNSFWNKFLKSINATLPPAGGPSSMDMIRGGGADLFGMPRVNDTADKRGPGQVKGAVNSEERAKGETGDDVDLQAMLGGNGAPGGNSGLYGDLMGQNLNGRFSDGGPSDGSAPYMNRGMFKGSGGSAGSAAGMYNSVLSQAASKVPVPGSPIKTNAKRLGRVSGFTWKNVGYRTNSAKMDVRINSKKPMFQLAETFAMTASAYKSRTSAPEYQASYEGSTYDGNDVNADVIQTDAAAPVVPDTSFTGDMINGTMEMQNLAKTCSDAQGTNGAQMSKDGKAIDDVSKTLGKPPKCCDHGGVSRWNGKINQIINYCNDFNTNEVVLAAKCQNKSSPMDCNGYNRMHISPCSKWKCWLGIILAILLMVVGFGLGIGLLVVAGIGLLISQLVPGVLGMILSAIVGGFAAVFVGLTLAQQVLSTIVQIGAGKASEGSGE